MSDKTSIEMQTPKNPKEVAGDWYSFKNNIDGYATELHFRLLLANNFTPALIRALGQEPHSKYVAFFDAHLANKKSVAVRENDGDTTQKHIITEAQRKEKTPFWRRKPSEDYLQRRLLDEKHRPNDKEAAIQRQLANVSHGTQNWMAELKEDSAQANHLISEYTPWYTNLWYHLSTTRTQREKLNAKTHKKALAERRKARLLALYNAITQEVSATKKSLAIAAKEPAMGPQRAGEDKTLIERTLGILKAQEALSDQQAKENHTLEALKAWYLNEHLKVIQKKKAFDRSNLEKLIHVIGAITAIAVSCMVGLITFNFAFHVYGKPLVEGIIFGGFGVAANLFVYWTDIPNTLLEILNGKIFKGFNPKTNSPQRIRAKRALLLAFVIPAVAVGACLGIQTYFSLTSSTAALIHAKIFLAISAGHPIALATVLAIVMGIAITSNIYRAFADFLKNDKERALVKFFQEFWHPSENTQQQSNFISIARHRAKNILTVVLTLGGLVAAGMATFALLTGFHHAAAKVLLTMPDQANMVITYALAGISRIPFVTKAVATFCGFIANIVAEGYTTCKMIFVPKHYIGDNDKVAYAKIKEKWSTLKEGIKNNPGVAFGIFYGLPRWGYTLFRAAFYRFVGAGDPYAWKRFKTETRNGLKNLVRYPWLLFGIVGALVATVGNAAGNLYLSDPDKTKDYERINAAVLSAEICGMFVAGEVVRYSNKPVPEGDRLFEGLYEAFQPEEDKVTELSQAIQADPAAAYDSLFSIKKKTDNDAPVETEFSVAPQLVSSNV